jgi:hypothetical protein
MKILNQNGSKLRNKMNFDERVMEESLHMDMHAGTLMITIDYG